MEREYPLEWTPDTSLQDDFRQVPAPKKAPKGTELGRFEAIFFDIPQTRVSTGLIRHREYFAPYLRFSVALLASKQ